MQIQSKSKLFRWAYLWTENQPEVTDLCSLFWRVMVMSPGKIIVAASAAVFALGVVGNAFIWIPGLIFYTGHPVWGSILVTAYSVGLLTIVDVVRSEEPDDGDVTVVSLFRHARRMTKGLKVCPIVYVRDD